MTMGTLVACSVVVFFLAVVSVIVITKHQRQPLHSPLSSTSASNQQVWPKLEFGWKTMVATVIGFLGSALGTVGGVGGGGIFVPVLSLILAFDSKSAAALSKCMIMAASTSSVWYNLRVQHPHKEVPILDYELALLFQPMLMLGITIGVALSVVFPAWLITVLVIILFIGTSSRSFLKAIKMWKEETLKNETAEQHQHSVNSHDEREYEPLDPREEKSTWNDLAACSTMYWVLNLIQFPVAFGLFGYEAIKLFKEGKKRKRAGNTEPICAASIEFTPTSLSFCALCGLLGGTVGGLLGSGGGFILGPLLLEIGVIPQVASATATFVMMFSSSLSVVEFYFLRRFPLPYALYLTSVSLFAGFWGQYFVRKLVAFLKRPSIIVFILSAIIFASAVTMGVIGTEKSIRMINNHEFMGFLDFCGSQ
ncbi:hypothetical protein Cgig2_019340 [Carnegiea gigantea]|uniref:Sulfite exporter TauE/SafE family protein n=1 Tax=Carnegiea gigantea TaxID=171969 RepID=A0A9Q1KPQ6_9CARY|nr:hypothetical protein Cgig2_019340 [Carnegiea gigantea]